MSTTMWAILMKPLIVAGFFAVIYGLIWLIYKLMPEGWLKRVLFTDLRIPEAREPEMVHDLRDLKPKKSPPALPSGDPQP